MQSGSMWRWGSVNLARTDGGRGRRGSGGTSCSASCAPSGLERWARRRQPGQIALMVRGLHHPLLTGALRCGLGIPGQKQLRAILKADEG